MTACRGFSLTQLLVVVGVAGLLMALAAPSLSTFAASQRLVGTSNRLLVEIQGARLLAVQRNRRVVICGSNDGEKCSGSADWSLGTLTFVDTNADGRRGDNEPTTSHVPHGDLNGLRVASTVGRPALAFSPSGLAGGSNLTLRLCAPDHPEWRQIIVNFAGRSRVNRPSAATLCPP